MNPYLEKLRTIGIAKGVTEKKTVEKDPRKTVITTEHADGVDVTVRPETVRYKAVTHKQGSKKGQVAEIKEVSR